MTSSMSGSQTGKVMMTRVRSRIRFQPGKCPAYSRVASRSESAALDASPFREDGATGCRPFRPLDRRAVGRFLKALLFNMMLVFCQTVVNNWKQIRPSSLPFATSLQHRRPLDSKQALAPISAVKSPRQAAALGQSPALSAETFQSYVVSE
jgi:hypothetical protein